MPPPRVLTAMTDTPAERRRVYDRRYRSKDRARYLLAKRAENRRYQQTHAEVFAHREARRRARQKAAPGDHALSEWLEKCALLGSVCIYCGEARPLTRDHNVPLVRGGSDAIENIVPACRPCNTMKGTRTAAEYVALTACA